MDEENSIYGDNANVSSETGNDSTGIISKGNVLSVDSNKGDSDIIGSESDNKTHIVKSVALNYDNKGSGDTSRNIPEENLIKCDKIESQLAKMTGESDSNAEKCSGDFVSKNSNESTIKMDLNDKNITFNEATASVSANIDKHHAAFDSHINKSDETDLKIDDDGLQGDEDDDMKLTWEDDDTGDQITGDSNKKSNKPLEYLSEEQLLEETDIEREGSDINLTLKKKEADSSSPFVEVSSPKVNLSEEKVDKSDEKPIEATSLVKTDNLVSSDIDPKIDKMEDNDLLKSLEKVPSFTKMSSEEIPTEKKDISNRNDVKDEEILAESDNTAKEVITDMENVEQSDNLLLEEQILENTEENYLRSDKISKTKVPMAKDLVKINDIVLEETQLKEVGAKTAEVTPEADVSMAKIDNDEEELLKDDELQEENTTMDVDDTDLLIDNQTKAKDDIHQPERNQDEVEENYDDSKIKHDEVIPIDNQAKLEGKNEKTTASDQSEIKNLPVIDEKSKLDPKIVDQQINKNDQIIDIPLETEQVDANTNIKISAEKPIIEKAILESSTNNSEVENILEPEKVPSTDISEGRNEDGDINESNISSICPEDSPIRNQTHGLHKPDVMLEIPTQELIDIDTDLSMNLDQSNDIDSLNADEKISDNIAIEKPANDSVAVLNVDKHQADNMVVDQSLGTEKTENPVVQKTIEEHLEQMFTDIEPASKEAIEDSATTPQPQQLDVQPSTFTMTPDTSDEVPEVSDSLGLLAESSGRVMEDDEEPEDDDDGEDDDDFDQDESSNHVSAEQSEDSNPPASEAEPARDQEEKEMETPESQDMLFDFTINNVECTVQEKADKMEIEVEEYGTLQLQAESIDDEETKSAVNALLKDVEGDDNEQFEEPNHTAEQMDIETVKLSDTSDNEAEETTQVLQEQHTREEEEDLTTQSPNKQSPSKQSLRKQSPNKQSPLKQSPSKQSQIAQSPSKLQKLAITTLQASNDVNIVDLEESSSSEDDIQEIKKPKEPDTTQLKDKPPSPDPESVTKVNIPTGIDVMCTSGGNTSDIVTKEREVVISGIPKPPPQKPARLNTGEVTIKTATASEPLVIPETKITEQTQPDANAKPKLSLEIFSLDSDDDDSATKEKPTTTSPHKMTALELEKARETSKCINYCCTSGKDVPYIVADAATVAYYDAGRKRRSMVCQPCAEVVTNRTKNLIQGIKNLTPLLDLEMGKMSQDLVEISDSESEDEDMTPDEPKESIGEKGAKFLEENLAQLLNETWHKYDMDCRLTETQIMLDDEMAKLEQDSKEIDAMLNECQVATDKLRTELYATFEHRRYEQPAIVLFDTPEYSYVGREIIDSTESSAEPITETRQAKRRLSSSSETVAKRPAIPLGYAPLDSPDNSCVKDQKTVLAPDTKLDDDKDISVVKLSAESAPADLPPPGEISRPPLRVGMPVYAMKNAFGPWLKGKILEIQSKNPAAGNPFSLCRVKFDHKAKTNGKILPARCIAYAEPADVRMTIGTRLIALFKDANKRESYYSGVVAEIPNPVNNYRYLVFFDDGYAQYVQHGFTRLVCESSPLVWEEVHPFSREFVREYLLAYPERPMVRLHEGQHLKTEWNGKWWSSRVIKVDASLAQVLFVGDGRREWIYRGSTRLAPLYLELRAAERHRPRPMPRSKAQPRSNMPYVEYTRSDEPEPSKQTEVQVEQQNQQNEEIRRQRAVAKKSTSVPQAAPPPQQQVTSNLDTVTSRVVYYTPKNAVKPYRMTPHKCGPKCKRSDVLSLKELRTYNPLAKPLLSGWERQIVRYKGHKEVMYRAPCGRRVRSLAELHVYLRRTDSELPVDLFDFHHATHCLAEFVLNKCLVGKKDLSHGKENVPVPCVNYYDESLPEFCSYNTERTPTAGVPLNLDPEFLCGCDCTDDCQDKTKCACWKMTLEGARTIGLDGPNVGYVYKRLPEPLPSGIYECNSRCKCKHTCLNRVAQHPLQLKLQVFKTPNRGWGIRALNDVPKGSFLCVYAGNLLTDATANLDGLNEGDEYLAELDYIEVVEQMKEGYEEDIPEADKKLDKKDQGKDTDDDDEPSSSEDDEAVSKSDKEDDDFRPGYIGLGVQEFSKRLRRRERSKKDKDDRNQKEKEKEKEKETKDPNGEEDCITISDDEEVREPSRFTVQAGMGAGEFISKYKSVRTLFGKDEACYIMDAKVQGNIGRYLNHSCCPNVFVQNVFVDTHDPRFPWVAFFALSHIKAGTELTWNYNYDVGSVPGKILYCYCGAVNCRGRLL